MVDENWEMTAMRQRVLEETGRFRLMTVPWPLEKFANPVFRVLRAPSQEAGLKSARERKNFLTKKVLARSICSKNLISELFRVRDR